MNQIPSIKVSLQEAEDLLTIQIEKGSDLASDLRRHEIIYNAPSMSWLRTLHNAWNHATELVLNTVFMTDAFTNNFRNISDEGAVLYNPETDKNEIDYDAVQLNKEVQQRVEWLREVRDTYLPIAVEVRQDQSKDNDFVKDLLHPDIRVEYVLLIQGEVEKAIALAFREVENKVRSASLPEDNTKNPTPLVRAVFHPETGILADTSRPIAEQQGIENLFAGAMLYYRNPSTHDRVEYERPQATRILLFASELLYEIERAVERHTNI